MAGLAQTDVRGERDDGEPLARRHREAPVRRVGDAPQLRAGLDLDAREVLGDRRVAVRDARVGVEGEPLRADDLGAPSVEDKTRRNKSKSSTKATWLLQRNFKDVTGRTVGEALRDERLRRVRALLSETTTPIGAIAGLCAKIVWPTS